MRTAVSLQEVHENSVKAKQATADQIETQRGREGVKSGVAARGARFSLRQFGSDSRRRAPTAPLMI